MTKEVPAVVDLKRAVIDDITAGLPGNGSIHADMLRLDEIHPVISGNKWFKLQFYLQEVLDKQLSHIVTFGGAYSNHIVASACAAKAYELQCTGIIRGEEPAHYSPSLQDAFDYGMHLRFVSRSAYGNKPALSEQLQLQDEDTLIIDEGGKGALGVKGAATILSLVPNLEQYTHIVGVAGSGTMLAGILQSALPHQQVIGISSLKGEDSMTTVIEGLAPGATAGFKMFFDYHMGGYAYKSQKLIDFMNEWYLSTQIPTDFVYSAKLVYATFNLAEKKYFPEGSRLLLIHCGGLQGNRSLPNGTLMF